MIQLKRQDTSKDFRACHPCERYSIVVTLETYYLQLRSEIWANHGFAAAKLSRQTCQECARMQPLSCLLALD